MDKKRRKPINYSQKTRDWLKVRGFLIDKVEQSNPFSGRKSDLFGIIDYLAIKDNYLIGIQSTSWACKSPHITTINANAHTFLWLNAGAKLILVCWKRLEKGKTVRYVPDVIEFIVKDGRLERVIPHWLIEGLLAEGASQQAFGVMFEESAESDELE